MLGNYKYKHLARVMSAIQAVPHSKADWERVFSMVRKTRMEARSTVSNETLESILIQKVTAVHSGPCHSSKIRHEAGFDSCSQQCWYSWIQYDTDRWAWHWLMSWQWCKYGAYTLRMRSSQVLSVLFSFLHYLRLYSWTVTSSVLLLVVTADFFLIATHCHLRLIVQKPTWSNHLSDAQMNLVSFLNFYYAIW